MAWCSLRTNKEFVRGCCVILGHYMSHRMSLIFLIIKSHPILLEIITIELMKIERSSMDLK